MGPGPGNPANRFLIIYCRELYIDLNCVHSILSISKEVCKKMNGERFAGLLLSE